MNATFSLLLSPSSSPPPLHHHHRRRRHRPPQKPLLRPNSALPSKSHSLTRADFSRDSGESRFLDEDGVVEDMDGYLNHLSLEYDSVWDTKPSWCQPWTISLTGTAVILCSWVFLHSVVITAVVSSVICAWWYIFLYAYPKAYSDMIADRRKKVSSGIEDTYGHGKNQ
ncbi:hypothetical protein QJS04_geneDACA015622 [Acorus gramineus]|uniref:DUF6737 domain-containing protein n=1 Tax=Acorus gramineus TaxID=55184 RepID=A0AAV9ASM9_ACOGR|nr:hypothetical protein QJS04_geneDACA015622 [Acorus gramineus]